MNLPEPKPPDPLYHAFLLRFLASSCYSTTISECSSCLFTLIPQTGLSLDSTTQSVYLCQAPRRSRHLQASLVIWSWPCCFRCPSFCTFVDCRHKRLCRLFFTVHKLTDWALITVSPHFRLLVVRSEIQVCFFLLFPSPFWPICYHRSYMMDSILKPPMCRFAFRFNSGNVLFCLCWLFIKLSYSHAKICWFLGQSCDALPDSLRMDSPPCKIGSYLGGPGGLFCFYSGDFMRYVLAIEFIIHLWPPNGCIKVIIVCHCVDRLCWFAFALLLSLSDVPSNANWICAYPSVLLFRVNFMVLVSCDQVQVWLVHVFVSTRATSQAHETGTQGWLQLSMKIPFLREIFRKQASLVTNLTAFERTQAPFISLDWTGCPSFGHWVGLVHRVFWHKDVLFCCVKCIVFWVALSKVIIIINDKCIICVLWLLEQHLWVLGMCLLVLGLHLMMLAHALQGLCSRCYPPAMRISWPIRGWFLQLSLIFTFCITIRTLSSYCILDYSVKAMLRLSYVDLLVRDNSSRSLAFSRALKCLKDDTVLFSSGCIFSLALSCTRYFVSVFEQHSVYECSLPPFVICNLCLLRSLEQHLRVLGLCLMALDVHHRMLDSLIMGAVLNRCFVPIRCYSLYIMETLFDVCTWKSFVLKPGSKQRGLLLSTSLLKGLPPTFMQ